MNNKVSQPDVGEQICNEFANVQEGQLILIIPVGSYDGTYFMDSI